MPRLWIGWCRNAIILLILSLCFCIASCEQVIQTFTGEIGRGNYTYFTMRKEGEVTLILDSQEGDADLYVSQYTLKPDFQDYDLQSTTCGRDIITVPKSFQRPIGIAVYGHVYASHSTYMLTVVMDYVGDVSAGNTLWGTESEESPEKQESLLWVIFVNILKIILEVIF